MKTLILKIICNINQIINYGCTVTIIKILLKTEAVILGKNSNTSLNGININVNYKTNQKVIIELLSYCNFNQNINIDVKK